MNVAALVVLGLSLAAAEPREPWIILVRTDGSTPASWRTAIQAAAKKAAAQSEQVTWQEPPAVSLEEAELALGCKAWGPACAGEIAKMMNANAALIVDLKADGVGATLKVQVVSSNGEPRGAAKEAALPDRGAAGLAITQGLVVSAIRGSAPTIVVIDSDVPGAEVTIDGVRTGVTPLTLVDELPAGQHKLVLSKEGRAPFATTIDIKDGVANPFTFPLGSGGPSAVEPTVGTQPASSSVMPTVAYTTTAAGGVLVVAAAALAAGYGWTDVTRKAIADSAAENGGIVPVAGDGGQQKTYKTMEDVAIPLAVLSVTSAAVGAVLLGTGVALLFVGPPPE